MSPKKLIVIALLLVLITQADDTIAQYVVRFNKTTLLLFKDYVNPTLVEIIDPAGPSDFNFHAQASGAEVNYDNEGRLNILPHQKDVTVTIFAEKEGVFYNLGKVKYECRSAPADGFGTEELKTKLDNVKSFKLPPGAKLGNSKMEIRTGAWLDNLYIDETNEISVEVYEKKDTLMTLLWDDVILLSPDAEIKKTGRNKFQVKPLADKKACLLKVLMNGIEVGRETFKVHPKYEG